MMAAAGLAGGAVHFIIEVRLVMTRHPRSAPHVRRLWLYAVMLLAALALAGGRAMAEADCGDDEPPKPTKSACPAGYKYSSKQKRCAKVSCASGSVWSRGAQACIDEHSAALTDQDFYSEAHARSDDGRYGEALALLARIKKQAQPAVLNMVGYNTRKLGDLDKGIDYYHKALALDPNYVKAREYLGEGYLQKGDLGEAKAELMEIADRCGTNCEEYGKLEDAILSFVGDGKRLDW
jgi:tetratricopeptide (TPR) repeat protein